MDRRRHAQHRLDHPGNWDSGLPSLTNSAVVNTAGHVATISAPMGTQTANTSSWITAAPSLMDNGGNLQVTDGNVARNIFRSTPRAA